MGAANDKEFASDTPISQYPFPCCTECTVCSARPVTASKPAESTRTWTEIDLAQSTIVERKSPSRQVKLRNG